MSLVITDASVLISLDRIDKLHILPDLFGEVIAPPAVMREFGATRSWLREMAPAADKTSSITEDFKLDLGEAEAIALALDHADAILLIDELRDRKFAEFHHLQRIVDTWN